MSAQVVGVDAGGAQGQWMYRVGGIAALVLGIGYFLTFPVYAFVGGPPPSGVEVRLAYFAEYGASWWAITALMVVTDLLYVPVWLAVYQALAGTNRNIMLLALACEGLFVTLDLAVTWTAYSSFITLGGHYAAASGDAQRAAILTAATAVSAMLDSPLPTIYAILIPSCGVLLAGLAMLKGVFSKPTAYLALAVGASGIVAGLGPLFTDALGLAHVVNAVLAMIWYFLASWQFRQLDRRSA